MLLQNWNICIYDALLQAKTYYKIFTTPFKQNFDDTTIFQYAFPQIKNIVSVVPITRHCNKYFFVQKLKFYKYYSTM